MKRIAGIAAVAAVVAALPTAAVHAADLSQAVILVASKDLDGSPFERTVVIAAPLPNGGHIGFIANRPTTVKLDKLLPESARLVELASQPDGEQRKLRPRQIADEHRMKVGPRAIDERRLRQTLRRRSLRRVTERITK